MVEIHGSVAELGDAGSRCASASGSTVRDVGGVIEGVADSLWTGCHVAELGVRIDADMLVLLSGSARLGSAGLGEERPAGREGVSSSAPRLLVLGGALARVAPPLWRRARARGRCDSASTGAVARRVEAERC